ncbi:MAG TPA: ABC transporter permease [Bryobacteraceae bacterium]|nr:ABC transporter permease [Bryobacteraceae bacterium]
MARIPGKHFLRNLIEGRTLLFQLVRRDFEQRFVGSAMGWLWGLIHPLVLLASWTFVFQWCLKQTLPPDEVTQNYTVFLFCGFLPWLLFQDTVIRSASCLVENANLITKTVFPSEIIPVSIFLSSLMSHLLALGLAVAVVGLWAKQLSAMVLLLPIYMFLLGLFAIGIGWVVSSLQVYLRDTAQVLSVVMTFWLWTTPIFISEQAIPPQVRFLVHLNPLAYVVRAYRERLLSYRPLDGKDILVLSAYAVAAFVLGGLFFRHLKRGFADVL